MPYSIVIRCFPESDFPVNAVQGRNLQAAFLDLIRRANPGLSASLHKGNQLRGYTVSALFKGKSLALDRRAKPESEEVVRAGTLCWLRFTLLTEEIYPALMKCLLSEKGAPGFSLGETEFLISEVLSTPESGDRWAGYSSAQDLWERASAEELRDLIKGKGSGGIGVWGCMSLFSFFLQKSCLFSIDSQIAVERKPEP